MYTIELILDSIMYAFGLGDNPFGRRKKRSDLENLSMDWKNVGKDIQTAIELYGQQQ